MQILTEQKKSSKAQDNNIQYQCKVVNKHILAVQQMQDYIQEQVDEDITLADLATVSLFFPWYSYQLFKRYTYLNPA